MKITVERLTDWKLVADCARNTVWRDPLPEGKEPSTKFKDTIVKSEHSPLRCLLYKVTMKNIPTFVSVHFVRHKMGVEHFISSNRPDRNGGKTSIDRNSPVNHIMIVNAQELLFMARRRLCSMASPETREVMMAIKDAVLEIDPIVASHMMPMCFYRHGCNEPNGCGNWDFIFGDNHGSVKTEETEVQ